MADIKEVQLQGIPNLPNLPGIQFVEAQISLKSPSHLVFVQYAVGGKRQKEGLRLDVDKRLFLDHFDDIDLETSAQSAAPHIAAYIGKYMR